MMIVQSDVAAHLKKVSSGDLDVHAPFLADDDFGIYLPIYERDGVIQFIPDGHHQIESNLSISLVSAADADIPKDMQVVAWLGPEDTEKDQMCDHPGTGPKNCKHCVTGHDRPVIVCKGHPKKNAETDPEGSLAAAPELDYEVTVARLDGKREVLSALVKKGFGLALLHGHSSAYEFTKLPAGYVSVISHGTTKFRASEDVAADPTFVPNTWRAIEGGFLVAGGYSQV